MTKTSGKSGTKTKKVKRKRVAKRVEVSVRGHAEDAIDGCDVEILDSQATPDIALPPAKGGVGRRPRSAKK